MRPIGGYFGLELPESERLTKPGAESVAVNSGRHALEYLLRGLQLKGEVKCVWIPAYTCEVVMQPLRRLAIPWRQYHIDRELHIATLPELGEGEYIIANNYYGILDAYMLQLAGHYGNRLIIDNAQAWYAPVMPGVAAFYSPRKFLGLPDGGVAVNFESRLDRLPKDTGSSGRMSHLLKRADGDISGGYADFRANSEQLNETPLAEMSRLTGRLLAAASACDDSIIARRRENYAYLDAALRSVNGMTLPDAESFVAPMVYPFFTEDAELRSRLISERVFVATYWPNVVREMPAESIEHQLASRLLPLPIDQRYESGDMQRIIDIIQLSRAKVEV